VRHDVLLQGDLARLEPEAQAEADHHAAGDALEPVLPRSVDEQPAQPRYREREHRVPDEVERDDQTRHREPRRHVRVPALEKL